MLATVLLGFGHAYYLAGLYAPPPTQIIHLHGAAFTGWILLFVTQTSLVRVGNVGTHRRLGFVGFWLACLMVVLGVLVATEALARNLGFFGNDPQTSYIIPLTDMVIFGMLMLFAFRNRLSASTHKRILTIATISLMGAPISRWPFDFVYHHSRPTMLVNYVFLLVLVVYDLWSTRRIHPATLWAAAFLIFVDQIRLPIGHTAAWHAFAAWAQSLACGSSLFVVHPM